MGFIDWRRVGFLNRMKLRFFPHLLLLAVLLQCESVQALETDQFYAWGKPIEDSSEYLNAWVRLQIQSALDSNSADSAQDCESAVQNIQKHLQHSIYQPIELWIISSNLVDRIPRGLEASREYRSHYLLSKTFSFDYARLLQPSPTLQVSEIRFGSDKLAHFFSEGWWYYKHWKKNRNKNTDEELQRSMFRYGVKLEQSIQGMQMTGVFSPGDLEANYQGFVFYKRMCHGEKPLLVRQKESWLFSSDFDFRDYVHPKWDESWNPNIYSPIRWKGIRSTMSAYCTVLNSEWVKEQRSHYAELDTSTPTSKLVQELVATGELPDPKTFSITSVCD
jgi:hypothetical protein